jgi:hypothetical protein
VSTIVWQGRIAKKMSGSIGVPRSPPTPDFSAWT